LSIFLERTRRLGWGVADQAISSLTNFALGVLVARAVNAREFGAFGIAFATYVMLMGIARAISSEPLVVKYSHDRADGLRTNIAQAVGVALIFGLLTGGASLIVGAATDGVVSDAFLLLGLALPGLMLQDAWRYAFFAMGRGRAAFANDLLWAISMLSILFFVEATGSITVRWAMISWGGGATLGAAAGIYQAGVLPYLAGARAWLADHRGLAARYLGEFLAISGSGQLLVYGIGLVIGLVGVGAFRGATVLVGPVHILLFGIGLVAIPEGVRLQKTGSISGVLKMAWLISVGLAAAALLWGMVLLLIPDSVGLELLGDTWSRARRIMLPFALSLALTGAGVGATIGLRAFAAAGRSFRARLLAAPAQPIAGIACGAVGGLNAAAWSLVFSSAFAAGVFWWHLAKAAEEARSAASIPAAP
jgi:O-antigen/teichoic acid export membrane protein